MHSQQSYICIAKETEEKTKNVDHSSRLKAFHDALVKTYSETLAQIDPLRALVDPKGPTPQDALKNANTLLKNGSEDKGYNHQIALLRLYTATQNPLLFRSDKPHYSTTIFGFGCGIDSNSKYNAATRVLGALEMAQTHKEEGEIQKSTLQYQKALNEIRTSPACNQGRLGKICKHIAKDIEREMEQAQPIAPSR